MKYLDIIEENFTHSDYVAYLRGSILKWLLEDKPLDLLQFKLYANKLVEVMDEPHTDEQTNETDVKIDVCRPIVKSTEETSMKTTVDPDEPQVTTPFKFKIGDHVLISKGTDEERTGVIVRLPMDGVDCKSSYVVDLDDKSLGWTATVAVDGVDCKNAWVANDGNMELLEEQPLLPPESPEKTLKKNKWYHTQDFTVEELKELLLNGTTVEVEKEAWYNGIETEPPTNTQTGVVVGISTSCIGDEPLIEINGSIYLKEWFKITEE